MPFIVSICPFIGLRVRLPSRASRIESPFAATPSIPLPGRRGLASPLATLGHVRRTELAGLSAFLAVDLQIFAHIRQTAIPLQGFSAEGPIGGVIS